MIAVVGQSHHFDRAPLASGLPDKQTFSRASACRKGAKRGHNLPKHAFTKPVAMIDRPAGVASREIFRLLLGVKSVYRIGEMSWCRRLDWPRVA